MSTPSPTLVSSSTLVPLASNPNPPSFIKESDIGRLLYQNVLHSENHQFGRLHETTGGRHILLLDSFETIPAPAKVDGKSELPSRKFALSLKDRRSGIRLHKKLGVYQVWYKDVLLVDAKTLQIMESGYVYVHLYPFAWSINWRSTKMFDEDDRFPLIEIDPTNGQIITPYRDPEQKPDGSLIYPDEVKDDHKEDHKKDHKEDHKKDHKEEHKHDSKLVIEGITFVDDKAADHHDDVTNNQPDDDDHNHPPPQGRHDGELKDEPVVIAAPSRNKLIEHKGDLFTTPVHIPLAHCVSECFAMGRGIAAIFKLRYGGVDRLLAQQKTIGEVATLKCGESIIYYLVTKPRYWHKPTLSDLERTLRCLKTILERDHITEIAMPLIGCGLDGLKWADVKRLVLRILVPVANVHVYTL